MPTQVVIVGGGVIGTQHAWRAIASGWRVTHLEREAGPRGASVRNFGLVWVSGRAPGDELALAVRARELWEQVKDDCPGTGFRAAGSLTVATDQRSVDALEAAAAIPDAATRGFALLTRSQALERCPALGPQVRGALWCSRDAAVEPGQVLGAIRERLQASGRYRWLPGRTVRELAPGAVVDHTGSRFEGDLVIVCTGADHHGVAAPFLEPVPVRRVRLQMLETAALGRPVGPALADIDSLRYYPAFAGAPRDVLPAQDPVARAWGAQLLCVQRLNGGLTIGDTHQYDEPFRVDYDAEPEAHLLGSAARLLGGVPAVRRRWCGVYSQIAAETEAMYARASPEPGLVVITGPGGRGMTLSPAIAEETLP